MAKKGSFKLRPSVSCHSSQRWQFRRVFMLLGMIILLVLTATVFCAFCWKCAHVSTKRHLPIVVFKTNTSNYTSSMIDDHVVSESLHGFNDLYHEFETVNVDNQTFLRRNAESFLTEDDQVFASFQTSRIHQRGFLEYARLAKKGAVLHCLLDGTSKPPATSWTSYTQLKDWGWTLEKNNVDYSYVSDQLNRGAGVEIGELKDGIGMTWTHSQRSVHQNVRYEATNGKYYNIFWPNKGVLMAMDNHGPQYQVSNGHGSIDPWKDTRGQSLPIVRLKNWSDVIFLSWASITSPAERTGLKWVLRRIIQNDLTKDIIGTIAMKRGIKPKWKGIRQGLWQYQAPVWPGFLISEEHEEFNALLATPNVSGMAWLLVQHREHLGTKTIKSIQIWNDMPVGNQYTPSMLIEIGAVSRTHN